MNRIHYETMKFFDLSSFDLLLTQQMKSKKWMLEG